MDENLLKALKRLNYGEDPKDKKDYVEVKTNNNLFNTIKLDSDYRITIAEPKIVFDYTDECEVTFEDAKIEDITEDSSYIKLFDKIMNNRDIILKSLYENTLEFLMNWEELEEENLDFVKENTHIHYIDISADTVSIKATVHDPNEEEEEGLLGGHFVETYIDLETNMNELEWDLT